MTALSAVSTAQTNVAVLAKCVVPLFGLNRQNELRLGGTGFLVQVGRGPSFLFTAGHVVDDFARSPMFVWPQDGQPVKILGDGFTSEPKRAGRSGDAVDLAVLALDRGTAGDLTRVGALFADSSCMSVTLPDQGVFAVIGFPHSANEPDIDRTAGAKNATTLYAEPKVIFATGCSQHDYARAKRTPLLNLMVQRQRRWAKSEDGQRDPRHGLRSPNGMSGGAMFYLGMECQLADGLCTPLLAGVFTRYIDKRRYMIGANARAMAHLVRTSARIVV